MIGYPLRPFKEGQLSDRFDWVIECMMAGLLAFMPFAFGVVEPWSEEVVVIVSGAMMICFLVKLIVCPEVGFIRTWAYLPLILFLVWVVIQLIPMPPKLLAILASSTLDTKTSLLDGLSQSGAKAMTISFYSLATERSLRLAMAVSAVFIVTVNVYRRISQIRRLLVTVVIISAGVSLLALAQMATHADKIYWRVPVRSMAGPYVNRNNFCQFISLSIGAGLGLLLVRLKVAFQETPATFSQVVERLRTRELRPVWYLSGAILLGMVLVFMSLSRGGMISLVIAWGVTIAVVGLKKRASAWGWTMCAMAVGVFACVTYVGFDSIYDRFASLGEAQSYGGRVQLVKDSARAWAKYPLVGVGLGAHEYVYPMFDQSNITTKASYVENEYVQMAEETGIIGLLLIGAFGAVVLRSYIRCIRDEHSPFLVVVIGLGAGLLAVVIHSAGDFGLHLPANACLAAVFCGLVVTMGRAGNASDGKTRKASRIVCPRTVLAVCLGSCVAVWVTSVSNADQTRRAHRYWGQAQDIETQIKEHNWAVAGEDYARLISLAEKAASCERGNAIYRYWLNVHRWRAISRITEPQTGNLVFAHGALGSVERIVKDLETASVLCPTFGPSYSLAGQLKQFLLGDSSGGQLIRKGRTLAPNDPVACFADGMLDASQGNTEASLATFRRVLTVGGDRWFDRIVKVYMYQIGRPDLAVALVSDSFGRLFAVAVILDRDGHASLAAKARAQAEELLFAKAESEDASAWVLTRAGQVCSTKEEYDRSATYYRRALSRNGGDVDLRMQFARVLAANEQLSEAREQAAVCLTLSPGMPAAKKLLVDLRFRAISIRDVE